MKWLNKKLGYQYDGSKRMWSKHRSKCHGATTKPKTTLDNHVLKVPFASLNSKEQDRVVFQPYCDYCHKPCKLVWKFKHE